MKKYFLKNFNIIQNEIKQIDISFLEKLTKLIEELVGEDGEGRYTFLEILQYIGNLKSIEKKYYE